MCFVRAHQNSIASTAIKQWPICVALNARTQAHSVFGYQQRMASLLSKTIHLGNIFWGILLALFFRLFLIALVKRLSVRGAQKRDKKKHEIARDQIKHARAWAVGFFFFFCRPLQRAQSGTSLWPLPRSASAAASCRFRFLMGFISSSFAHCPVSFVLSWCRS
jgi:hypothetical protein